MGVNRFVRPVDGLTAILIGIHHFSSSFWFNFQPPNKDPSFPMSYNQTHITQRKEPFIKNTTGRKKNLGIRRGEEEESHLFEFESSLSVMFSFTWSRSTPSPPVRSISERVFTTRTCQCKHEKLDGRSTTTIHQLFLSFFPVQRKRILIPSCRFCTAPSVKCTHYKGGKRSDDDTPTFFF